MERRSEGFIPDKRPRLSDRITREEIAPGLMMNMVPAKYQDASLCSLATPVLQNGKARAHLCIYVEGIWSAWSPLFSTPGGGRFLLSDKDRRGHSFWTKGEFRAHSQQVWLMRYTMVQLATYGTDHSQPGKRNAIGDEDGEWDWIVEPETDPHLQYGPMLDLPNLVRKFTPHITGCGSHGGFLLDMSEEDQRESLAAYLDTKEAHRG